MRGWWQAPLPMELSAHPNWTSLSKPYNGVRGRDTAQLKAMFVKYAQSSGSISTTTQSKCGGTQQSSYLDLSAWEPGAGGYEIQSHPLLHSKFKASQGYETVSRRKKLYNDFDSAFHR